MRYLGHISDSTSENGIAGSKVLGRSSPSSIRGSQHYLKQATSRMKYLLWPRAVPLLSPSPHRRCSASTGMSNFLQHIVISRPIQHQSGGDTLLITIDFMQSMNRRMKLKNQESLFSHPIKFVRPLYLLSPPRPAITQPSLPHDSAFIRDMLDISPKSFDDKSWQKLATEDDPLSSTRFNFCSSANGFILVRQYAFDKIRLNGTCVRRINMAPKDSTDHQTILASSVTHITGIGRCIICLTAAYRLFIFGGCNMRLCNHFRCDRLEYEWLRYASEHAHRPPPVKCVSPTRLMTPDEYGCERGFLMVGSSTGLVQIWDLPSNRCEVLLPPPLPLGDAMPVLGIAWQRFFAYESGSRDCCIEDEEFALTTKARLFTYVWIFFGDGRATIWQVDGSVAPGLEPPNDQLLPVADVFGPWQRFFPSIDLNLVQPITKYRIDCVFDWQACDFTKETSFEFIQYLPMEHQPILFLLVRDRKTDAAGILLLSPIAETPYISFHALTQLSLMISGIPNACTARLYLSPFASEPDQCILLESEGILYVLEIIITSREPLTNHVVVDIAPHSHHIIALNEPIASMRYEEAFDELLLSLRSGVAIAILNLSSQIRSHVL